MSTTSATTTREALHGLRRRALENRDDSAAFFVLADALMSDGDELGAFILDDDALTPALQTRLLGRLEGRSDFWEFESGFLRTVELSPLPVQAFRSVIGLREWEGVNALRLNARRGRVGRSQPTEDVLRLITHEVCKQLRVIEDLDFEAFVGLCDEDRTFERLGVVGLPHWGVNTPLETGRLTVKELSLTGTVCEPAIAWLKTWGRAVFDKVEVLRLDGPSLFPGNSSPAGPSAAMGLELVTNRPGSAVKEVIGRNWSATREGPRWHFDLRLVEAHIMSLAQAAQLCALMRHRLSPIASRFSIRVPKFPEEELRKIREAAGAAPVEFAFSWPWPPVATSPEMAQLLGDLDAPF